MPLRLRLAIGAPQSPLARWVALSLLGHTLLTWVWVGMSRRSADRTPPNSVPISVVLAAGPRPPKAGAVQKPARVEATPPIPLPPPPKPQTPRPEPSVPKKPVPSPKPAPSTPRVADPDPVSTVADPLSGTTGEAGGAAASIGADGASVSAIDLGGSELAWYRDAVSNRLYQTWRQPLLDAVRDPLEVQIRFSISADGRVLEPAIERSSGVPSLDRSALRAVTEASPLPPLPRGWRDSPIEASFVFRLFPEDR